MAHINKCPGCFNNSSENYPCPSCGYTDPTEEATLYLPLNSILVEKYQIDQGYLWHKP